MKYNVRKLAVFLSTIPICFVVSCLAAEPIGYAWPKSDLLITDITPSGFKTLKNHGTYPVLVRLDSGYSIVCEGGDGHKCAALLPLRDRFGEPLKIHYAGGTIEVSSEYIPVNAGGKDALGVGRGWSADVDLNTVDLKPGLIPLYSGVSYPVLTKSEGNLSIQFTSDALTQVIIVPESQTKFLTLTEIAGEAAREEQRKAKEEEQRRLEQAVLKVEPVLNVQSSEARHQLFSPEALSVMQFRELDAAVSFLRGGPQSDIKNYISPQVGMRTAADELQALLRLIRVDQLSDVEQATPSTKVEVLERFLSELSLCEQLAKVNISREWVVDTRMENLENQVTSFRSEQTARRAYLRSDMLHCAMLTVVALLLTAVVALMLLIVRDFFSALIDTAVNTGASANTLDRMSQGDTGDRGDAGER